MSLRTSLVSFFVAFGAHADVLADPVGFRLAVCVVGTECQQCRDRASVIAEPDVRSGEVRLVVSPERGAQFVDTLQSCVVTTKFDWECRSFRGVLGQRHGRVFFSPAQPPVLFDGAFFEQCATSL